MKIKTECIGQKQLRCMRKNNDNFKVLVGFTITWFIVCGLVVLRNPQQLDDLIFYLSWLIICFILIIIKLKQRKEKQNKGVRFKNKEREQEEKKEDRKFIEELPKILQQEPRQKIRQVEKNEKEEDNNKRISNDIKEEQKRRRIENLEKEKQ